MVIESAEDIKVLRFSSQAVCSIHASKDSLIVFEPVSSVKSLRALSSLHRLDYISPNAQEAVAMAEELHRRETNRLESDSSLGSLPSGFDSLSAFAQIRALSSHLSLLLRVGILGAPSP